MFFDLDIKADRLPHGTLCLTYDDGPGQADGESPGPRTRELGQYLFEQGIQATFFVIGRHAEGHRGLLRQLQEWDHLIANHTYGHPPLAELAGFGGDVVEEVARADAIIREYTPGDVVFLRPPYGSWMEKTGPHEDDKRTSVVAEVLNRSRKLRHYVGPVTWDISSLDWEHWRQGDSAKGCADACLQKIERLGRGIILMHDSSEDANLRARNLTMQATRLLVPILKDRGYRFVRLDAVPQVQSAVRVSSLVTLRTALGHGLTRLAGGDEIIVTDLRKDACEEPFGVVPLGRSQIALRASNGQYLSPRPGDGEILASAPWAGSREALVVQDLGGDRIALRASGSNYLVYRPDGRLFAGPSRRGDGVTFHVRRRA